VLTFTPGIVSLTAAVCVVIATGGEERIIKSTNWLTLFYIALYRYTTEVEFIIAFSFSLIVPYLDPTNYLK